MAKWVVNMTWFVRYVVPMAGILVLLAGAIDFFLIASGWGDSSWFRPAILVSGGILLVSISLIVQVAREEVALRLLPIMLWLAIWASIATQFITRTGAGERWDWTVAIAVAITPIAILVNITYGDKVRDTVVKFLKERNNWNAQETTIARNIVRGLPVSESMIYAATASTIATKFFLGLGEEGHNAAALGFLLVVIPGSAAYYFHTAIRELKAFVANPKDFM